MVCPNCKKEVTSRFCPDCGLELNPGIPQDKPASVEKPRHKKEKRPKAVKPFDKTIPLIIVVVLAAFLIVVLATWGATALFDQYRNGLEWLFYN